MDVPHDAAVGHHVHVLVHKWIRRVAIVHMTVVMQVVVRTIVALVVIVVMPMHVTMNGSVRVHVLVLMRRVVHRAFDLGFAAAASTGRAHDGSPRCRLSRRWAAPKPTGGPLRGQRTQ
jgi:hypothetical protein